MFVLLLSYISSPLYITARRPLQNRWTCQPNHREKLSTSLHAHMSRSNVFLKTSKCVCVFRSCSRSFYMLSLLNITPLHDRHNTWGWSAFKRRTVARISAIYSLAWRLQLMLCQFALDGRIWNMLAKTVIKFNDMKYQHEKCNSTECTIIFLNTNAKEKSS